MAEKEIFNGLVGILRNPHNFTLRVHKRIMGSVITPKTNLHDELGFTKTEDYGLGTYIGEDFDINIPDKEIEEFRTLGEYADYIEKHSSGKRQVS